MAINLNRSCNVVLTDLAARVDALLPTPDSSLASYTGLVASEGRQAGAATTSSLAQGNFRSYHVAPEIRTDLGIVFPHWYWDYNDGTEKAPAGTLTGEFYIEYPAGTFQRLTVGGSNTATCNSGEEITTDIVTLTTPIPANTGFWIRGYLQSTAGFVYDPGAFATVRNGTFAQSRGEEFEYAATVTNKAGGGTITSTVNNNTSAMARPLALIGTTKKASVLVYGDSICWGANSSFLGYGAKGPLAPSLGLQFGVTNIGSYGDSPSKFIANHAKRVAIGRYATHIVCQAGINALQSAGENKTASTVLSELQTVYGYWPSKKIIQTTVGPRNTDTNFAQINSFNDAIRAKPSPLIAYYDLSDVLSTARNSNVFRTGYNFDTIHPNTVGHQAILESAVVNSNLIFR